mgnify:CR=1 FL=1
MYQFESETVKFIGILWAASKFGSLLLCAVLLLLLWTLIRWFMSGCANYLSWKRKSSEEAFRGDADKWEHEIDDRGHRLDTLKKQEMEIRKEIDRIFALKAERDKLERKDR